SPSPPGSSSASTHAGLTAAEDASPDSKCPICLDRFNNLAYLDRCLHRFCFPCIQEWSHNKAECPLCKQPFASILHSVRAEDDFKEYTLQPAPNTSSVAATVAMVAAMASAARSNHQSEGAASPDGGVIFEGMMRLGGAAVPLTSSSRDSRRMMSQLAARRRMQQDSGAARQVRERETVAFRRSLYRCGIRAAGIQGQPQQQHDVSAESFRRSPELLERLQPWRRELTVLYGAHGSLVDIIQRIIVARLARHGLEDTPTIEEELRPFLLARTEHFLHELVSFARCRLSLERYDLQALYEPPAAAQLEAISSSSDRESIIAISEGEEEQGLLGGDQDRELLQTRSSLSQSAWDDEAPGPSYSAAEPSCSLSSLSFSPAPCLIVGYKKPMAERTPELVQLSSDSQEEQEEEKTEGDKPPVSTRTTPPPRIPPSTSGTHPKGQEEELKEKDKEACQPSFRAGSSRSSTCGPERQERTRKKLLHLRSSRCPLVAKLRQSTQKQRWSTPDRNHQRSTGRAWSSDRKSSTRKSSTRKSSARKSSTRKSSTRKGSTRKSSTRKGSTRKSSNRKSSTRKSSNRKSSNRKGSNRKGSTRKSSNRKGSTRKGSTRKSSNRKGSTRKSSTRKSSNRKSSTRKSSNRKGSNRKGSTRKSSTRKSSNRKGSNRKGSTRKSSNRKSSRKSSTRKSSNRKSSNRKGSNRKGSTRRAPTGRGSNRKGSTRKSSNRKSSNRKGSTRKSSTRKSANRKGSNRKGSTRKGSTRKSSNRKSSTRKGSNRKSSKRKGSTRKSSTRKSSTRKSSTRKGSNRKSSNRKGSTRKS
uniref:E3 ubiquitin-protein ligase Topors n=1 Tax=Tetraodon nigroviridis TaxID=99883 RepID=H3C5K4_TETNG